LIAIWGRFTSRRSNAYWRNKANEQTWRWGNRKIEITQVEFLDENRQPKNIFQTGDYLLCGLNTKPMSLWIRRFLEWRSTIMMVLISLVQTLNLPGWI